MDELGLDMQMLIANLSTFGPDDYLDAQRVLFDQQDALAQSRGNVITDVVQLNRALGGGWSLADTDPDLALEMARSDASDAAAAANRTDSDANGAGSAPAQENEVN